MANIDYNNNNSPQSNIKVTYNSWRDGERVYIRAVVVASFRFRDGWIGKGDKDNPHIINFNMWANGGSASVNIKQNYEEWRASNQMSRTRECTMVVTNTSGDTIQTFCNVTHANGHSMTLPDWGVWVEIPVFEAPKAPTSFNVEPNPCSINSAPTLTWGGAKAGSLSQLYYDVEVQSSTPSGWTNWLRISNAQKGTSYNEIVLKDMNVHGQRPFLGVKYQYRIRTSDGEYSTSGWVYKTVTVSFGSPTPPTNYRFNNTIIKKDGSVNVSWWGAGGGTGSIVNYDIDYEIYSKAQNKWLGWKRIKTLTTTNYTFNVPSFYSQARNGDLIKFRIRVKNSWGQYSTYLTTGNVQIRGNQMWIKINGTWKESDTYFKKNGQWGEATPYVKVNGSWKEST